MKKFIHLSELQFFANRPTSILFNDGSIMVGFSSCFDASNYCTQNNIQYKEILNECIIIKY